MRAAWRGVYVMLSALEFGWTAAVAMMTAAVVTAVPAGMVWAAWTAIAMSGDRIFVAVWAGILAVFGTGVVGIFAIGIGEMAADAVSSGIRCARRCAWNKHQR